MGQLTPLLSPHLSIHGNRSTLTNHCVSKGDIMKRVTGIGGIFFKSKDPTALKAWYRQHLEIESGADGGIAFEWREKDKPDEVGMTVWAPFREDTKYFEPSKASFMINYRVEDLDAVLDALRAEGVTVADETEDSEYGRFGWVMDPEGNRLELWQPPAGKQGGTG
jgi:predicted enzyme related to lactoylglutathione lyase